MINLHVTTVLMPLIASIVAGLFGAKIGRERSHQITIAAVGLSFLISLYLLINSLGDNFQVQNYNLYSWAIVGNLHMDIGFLIDRLSLLMMVVVTFVSLMVHIYTIGYMHDDPGYQRFFSYISLFTFAMLMLVMSNNFLQLFFGWEAVGLVSYLLIGFWFKRESAVTANLKAFLVNRVGDFGFLLGIAGIVFFTNSLDYYDVFSQVDLIASNEIKITETTSWNAMTMICVLLFIGAMGKSAQAPLHVWLPDSMEGPTPISALIHAATMVTAGIFMVARMSPLFELSEMALAFVLIIGSVTAFFMGLLGIIQNDIKRVVAYSTLSQLGYMTVALGVSAYSAAIFHLMTHAFFKALLFLAAGSVIIAMHHEQDIRKMGGLKKYMPITYVTSLIGTLALVGFPGSAGFFSKDVLIETVKYSHWLGDGMIYWISYLSVLLGVFITSLYSFRMFFMVFHGEERMDKETKSHLHETPTVVTMPLILLAIPSVFVGWFTIKPLLFGEYFDGAIQVLPQHDVLAQLSEGFHGSWDFLLHSFTASLAFYMAFLGFLVAWLFYIKFPEIPNKIRTKMRAIVVVLEEKYFFDTLWMKVFPSLGKSIGRILWKQGDEKMIDGALVNGTAYGIRSIASVIRNIQTGYLYHYAFAMIVGLVIILSWLLWT